MSKDTAEQTILTSLDKVISDFAKPNAKKQLVRTRQKKKTSIESSSDSIQTNVLNDESKVINTKKQKDLKVFFDSKDRKQLSKNFKISKKLSRPRKSPYFSGRNFNFTKNISNFYLNYKKTAATAVLVFGMLGLVTATTYATYAYVTSRDVDLIHDVARHVVLPENETPKVYIVQSSKAEIFQNPLFKGIQVGDNVLTYSNAGKVYIYRSSQDKIVNIVNLQN